MGSTTECDGGRRTQLEFSVGLGLNYPSRQNLGDQPGCGAVW